MEIFFVFGPWKNFCEELSEFSLRAVATGTGEWIGQSQPPFAVDQSDVLSNSYNRP